jgi:hypothetical protein
MPPSPESRVLPAAVLFCAVGFACTIVGLRFIGSFSFLVRVPVPVMLACAGLAGCTPKGVNLQNLQNRLALPLQRV